MEEIKKKPESVVLEVQSLRHVINLQTAAEKKTEEKINGEKHT